MITDYRALIDALRARRVALGLSIRATEDKAGFSEGHLSHLEGYRGAGGNGRAFGPVSMPLWLGALDVGLVLVDRETGEPIDLPSKEAA